MLRGEINILSSSVSNFTLNRFVDYTSKMESGRLFQLAIALTLRHCHQISCCVWSLNPLQIMVTSGRVESSFSKEYLWFNMVNTSEDLVHLDHVTYLRPIVHGG